MLLSVRARRAHCSIGASARNNARCCWPAHGRWASGECSAGTAGPYMGAGRQACAALAWHVCMGAHTDGPGRRSLANFDDDDGGKAPPATVYGCDEK